MGDLPATGRVLTTSSDSQISNQNFGGVFYSLILGWRILTKYDRPYLHNYYSQYTLSVEEARIVRVEVSKAKQGDCHMGKRAKANLEWWCDFIVLISDKGPGVV